MGGLATRTTPLALLGARLEVRGLSLELLARRLALALMLADPSGKACHENFAISKDALLLQRDLWPQAKSSYCG